MRGWDWAKGIQGWELIGRDCGREKDEGMELGKGVQAR